MVQREHSAILSTFIKLPVVIKDKTLVLLYPLFSLEKKGYINFVSKSVRLSVRPSVTFLVNVSSPKSLEVVTSNFVVE